MKKIHPRLHGLRVDGKATRARIMEAAGELFAAHGFAQTSSKAIAAQAGVDAALINYHFGSYSGLYQAVLAEAHRRLIDFADLEQLAQSAIPAADKLKAVMRYLVQSALGESTPWHIPVLTSSLLAPSPQTDAVFQSQVNAKASIFIGILSEITGIEKTDPVLQRCLISVMAPGLWLQIGRRGMPGPVQELLKMPSEVLVEHLYQFSLAGLHAISPAQASSPNLAI